MVMGPSLTLGKERSTRSWPMRPDRKKLTGAEVRVGAALMSGSPLNRVEMRSKEKPRITGSVLLAPRFENSTLGICSSASERGRWWESRTTSREVSRTGKFSSKAQGEESTETVGSCGVGEEEGDCA